MFDYMVANGANYSQPGNVLFPSWECFAPTLGI